MLLLSFLMHKNDMQHADFIEIKDLFNQNSRFLYKTFPCVLSLILKQQKHFTQAINEGDIDFASNATSLKALFALPA